MKAPKYPYYFIGLSMICLLACVLMGLTGAFQYVFPALFKSLLSFEKIRPMHTLLATSWILLAAIGGIYFYLHQEGLPIKAVRWLPWLHFELFVGCGLIAAGLYIAGIFGGREYMEFVYPLSAPILLGWLLFAYNYFTSVAQWTKPWPVYFWMWATGAVFFIFTFSESFLWLFPYFRNHIVRDITVQWKANGALVGSWNMLIYGTSIYVMNKIKPDSKSVRGTLPFALFFVGLTNLMFGWAHHTYIVPAAPWVRHVSYLISMTEWLLLARVIFTWKKSLLPETKLLHLMTYKLLYSANVWVFINLAIALLISIPAINYYTHGTQITVAHAMGTTIGINTPLLLASLFLILG
ncbi:MAG: cbb3-type cytochrome c oxidase subunit I, partial [Bacteroidia bacterium]|nr:cbb3-type cytochrome c oxidase subunit I [Bacteroidia bacterium]